MEEGSPERPALRPSMDLAVVLEREARPNRWEDWRFRIVEVLPDEGAFGTEPRLLRDDGKFARWLHPGFRLELFRDEAEGYYLNLSSGTPVWFVTWRTDEADPARAHPQIVSVSYHEAGRWQVSLVLVMPDHVHAVVSVPPGEALLKTIVAWKAFSTRQHGVHWQRGFFDHRLRSADERERKLEYIRQNPVRAGLVTAPDEWPWQWQPAGDTTLPPW